MNEEEKSGTSRTDVRGLNAKWSKVDLKFDSSCHLQTKKISNSRKINVVMSFVAVCSDITSRKM